VVRIVSRRMGVQPVFSRPFATRPLSSGDLDRSRSRFPSAFRVFLSRASSVVSLFADRPFVDGPRNYSSFR